MQRQAIVYLVDDDDAVRDALSLLLKTASYKVASYPSAQAFFDAYRPDHPACLISDVMMPEIDGLELQQQLASRDIDIPIIFITGHGNIDISVRAVKAGALDFLEKPIDEQKLLLRVAEAIEQDMWKRAEIARKTNVVERCQRLTPREREVGTLVIDGYSNKQIARQLGISHRTVEIHRTRLMEKMQVDSLPELVTVAFDCCLIRSHSE